VDPDGETRLRARLGPDPLRDDDPAPAFAALRRRRSGIGQVLLDQTVIAGIETSTGRNCCSCWESIRTGPAGRIDRAAFDELWRVLRGLLGRRRTPRAHHHDHTLGPLEAAVTPAGRRAPLRLQARRMPCRRCGTSIRSWDLGSRAVFACPSCQAA
jgi:hypothetical protein